MEDKEKFLVIDGNSIMNRAFYAIKLLTTKDGMYTNAIYGFLSIYYMMLEKLKPDYVAVSFDLSAPTFRHKMYDKYKANRKSMPDELRLQMPVVKDVLRAMNITIIEKEGFEADDVLGTIAAKNISKNIFTYLLTGDKDSFQIISDSTSVVIPISKMGRTEYKTYTPEALKEKYNISPSQVIEVKALMGDASDNIPGIPGIGEKTAYSLIVEYESINNIYENIEALNLKTGVLNKLLENKEIAYLSKDLATIDTNVPIILDYKSLKLGEVNIQEISKLFTRLQFKKFLDKYSDMELFEDSSTIDILNGFDAKNFYKIEKEEALNELINENKENKIYFMHFDNIKPYAKFKDTLFILSDKKIHYFKVREEDNKNNNIKLIKMLAVSDIKKHGYQIKHTLKHIIDIGQRNIRGFKSDVKIAYYLLHPEENNYTLENIAYNLLGLNFPVIEDKKIVVQTSIFDVLDNANNKLEENDRDNLNGELSLEEKKYIYSYLLAIKKIDTILISELKEKEIYDLYKNIEIPLIQTLADIESFGMYIDKKKLQEFGIYLDENISRLKDTIFNLTNEDFNINSPQQLGVVLFDKLKLPYYKKGATSYSTDKDTLEMLLDLHPVIKEILEYRGLAKLKSTYVDGMIDLIDDTGRLHTTFMQTVTATGRLSSTNPNLQNIPVKTELGGRVRECFMAKGTDVLIDADYSQIELRVLAHMAKDETMISAFRVGEDIHTSTAAKVFDIPSSEVTKEQRGKAKAVNFGIVYGISDYGLSKNISVSREEAKKYIDNYLAKYSKIDEYMKNIIKEGEEKGYVSTIYGRRRSVPELKSGNHNTVMFGRRIAMNMPIQGSAADIMKKAMNDIFYTLLEKNMKSRIIMQVHDELIVETIEEEIEEVKFIMKTLMKNVIKLDVPLEVDINSAKNWYEAK